MMGRGVATRGVVVWIHWRIVERQEDGTVLCAVGNSGEGARGAMRCIIGLTLLYAKYLVRRLLRDGNLSGVYTSLQSDMTTPTF